MEMIDLLAFLDFGGLEWDPHVRGFLAVLAGFIVWMGSIWLIVSSNSGVRLGTLLSLAGLFGWLAIMGSIWWIYGIGWAGDAPIWEEVEIVEGTGAEEHLTFAALDEANLLRTESIPSAHEAVVAAAEAAEAEFGADWQTMGPAGLSNDAVDRLVEIQIADANSASSSPSASRPTRSRACHSPRSTHSSPPSRAATRRPPGPNSQQSLRA